MNGKLERLGLALLDPDGTSRSAPGVSAFLILSALLLGGVMLAGPYPITLFATDTMHTLVQGDFLVRGYRPYVDFFSLYGPIPALFAAAGIATYGISLWALIFAQALAAAVFGALMFKVAISRLHAVWAVVLAISVELLLISCTPLGRRSWREFSSAMWYNSMCFCITAILFLYVLLPSRSSRPLSRWIDAGIAAVCLMATFLTKVSFFPPLLIILVVGTILWPRGAGMRLQGFAVLGLATLMSFGMMWTLGGTVLGYLKFIRSISLSINPLVLALRYLHHTRTIGAFLVTMALSGWVAQQAGLLRAMRREWFLAFLMFGAMLATAATCKQDPEALPLIGIIPLAITVLVAALARDAGRTINVSLASAAMLSALLLATHDSKNSALSWVFSRMSIKTIEPAVERLHGADSLAVELVSDRVDPKLFALMPKEWVETTFKALALLKDAGAQPGNVLHVATITNGITILTDLKYARGDSPWSPVAAAVTPAAFKPPIDDMLSDADWILRDRDRDDYWEFLTHYRGEYIAENFKEVSSNNEWILYGRKNRSAAAPAAPSAGEAN
jgi:hypothetical protein